MAQIKEKKIIDKNNIPAHIAFIMDGNGRWAKNRGFSRSVGHREGAKAVKKVTDAAYDLGVRYLTFFAFSSENWSRPKEEVDELMKLYLHYLKDAENDTSGMNVRIRIIGSREGLSQELVNQIEKVELNSRHNDRLNLVIALNYGGHQDILQAVRKAAEDVQKGTLSIDGITEKEFSKRLYTQGIPDPDLLIRTSGEMRLSNFLIWQTRYTELYFPSMLWPDFNVKHFEEAIIEYQRRNRRFGALA